MFYVVGGSRNSNCLPEDREDAGGVFDWREGRRAIPKELILTGTEYDALRKAIKATKNARVMSRPVRGSSFDPDAYLTQNSSEFAAVENIGVEAG